jgi:hypothetical protein
LALWGSGQLQNHLQGIGLEKDHSMNVLGGLEIQRRSSDRMGQGFLGGSG